MPKQLFLIVLAVFFTQLAWAQQFYKWKDEKGQWHYSDFAPTGVTAEKLAPGDTAQKSVSQPSVSSKAEQKKNEDSSNRSTRGESDVDPLRSVSTRLLVFPPSDPSKPLSQWIPMDSFASVKECERARALQNFDSGAQRSEERNNDIVDFRKLNSRCISLAEFKPSKAANVIMSVTALGPDPGGFSTSVLYGRVFNGGQTTARNVVVRYRSLDARGIIYAEGDIPTAPQDISPLTFAEFRGQMHVLVSGSDRWVETEAKWSKDLSGHFLQRRFIHEVFMILRSPLHSG